MKRHSPSVWDVRCPSVFRLLCDHTLVHPTPAPFTNPIADRRPAPFLNHLTDDTKPYQIKLSLTNIHIHTHTHTVTHAMRRQAAEFVAASGGPPRQNGSGPPGSPPRGRAGTGSPKAGGGGSVLDDGSEGGGDGNGGIPGEAELAEAMDGVDLDETKFSKVGSISIQCI